MNEFGEPNMGNPSVRFDEGRSGNAGLTTAVGSTRLFRFAYSAEERFGEGRPQMANGNGRVLRMGIIKRMRGNHGGTEA